MGTVEVRAAHRDLYIPRCDREERGVRDGVSHKRLSCCPRHPAPAGCRGLSHRKGQRETTSCQVFMNLHRIADINPFAMRYLNI